MNFIKNIKKFFIFICLMFFGLILLMFVSWIIMFSDLYLIISYYKVAYSKSITFNASFLEMNSFNLLETPFNLYYTSVPPELFIILSSFLFILGLFGLVLNTENLIFTLVSMELILLSVTLNFTYFSVNFHEPKGQIFAILLLGVAASEAAVGLSLLLVASKMKNSIKTVDFSLLKG